MVLWVDKGSKKYAMAVAPGVGKAASLERPLKSEFACLKPDPASFLKKITRHWDGRANLFGGIASLADEITRPGNKLASSGDRRIPLKEELIPIKELPASRKEQ